MADDIDLAQERDEMLLRAQIARRMPVLPFVGSCYNCEEPLAEGLFCDADCRLDHEKREQFRTGAPQPR